MKNQGAPSGKNWEPGGVWLPMAAGKKTLLTLGANIGVGCENVCYAVEIAGTDFKLYLQAQKDVRFVFGMADQFVWVRSNRAWFTRALLDAPEAMGAAIVDFLNQFSRTRYIQTGTTTRAAALAWVGYPDG